MEAKKLAYTGLFKSIMTYYCDIWGFTNKATIAQVTQIQKTSY